MKSIVLTMALVGVLPHLAVAQPKRAAEDAKKIQDYLDGLPPRKAPGELAVELAVGAHGIPTNIDAKVIQVIDKESMLVGLEDSRTNKGNYSKWVLVKASTAGIVDGAMWRGWEDWKRVTGSQVLSVTGTAKCKTPDGGTRTVFVLEAAKEATPAVKKPRTKEEEARAIEAERFVGKWRIEGEKGAVACYFTLADTFTAKKSHAPDVVGVWEVIGDEARIMWSDGWKDVLRLEQGSVTKIAFGPKMTWTDKPVNTQKAVKEMPK